MARVEFLSGQIFYKDGKVQIDPGHYIFLEGLEEEWAVGELGLGCIGVPLGELIALEIAEKIEGKAMEVRSGSRCAERSSG